MNRPLTEAERTFMATAIQIMQQMSLRERQRLFYKLYPDDDNDGRPEVAQGINGAVELWARHRYAKHLEFFQVGAKYRERCIMAANRIGKTFAVGGYELASHLTGEYPDWWEGRRFTRPIQAWAAGKTNETTRDIVQRELVGNTIEAPGGRKMVDGAGIIPGRRLGKLKWKINSGDLLDTIKVRHISGGWSTLGIKSYQQGRGSFEGTAKHVIWLDEEPPLDIYNECVIRTATTDGIVMLTFTPLEGLSETVLQFLPGMNPDA